MSNQVALTLYELGRCVREAGRPAEAAQHLKQALEMEDAKRDSDDNVGIAMALHSFGRCSEMSEHVFLIKSTSIPDRFQVHHGNGIDTREGRIADNTLMAILRFY